MRRPSSSAIPVADPRADLKVKLTWVTVFRTVATTLLLVIVAVRALSARPMEVPTAAELTSFVLLGVVYLLTVLYALLLRRGIVGEGPAWGQVAGDVVIASCLVFLTGGPDSPFTFVYSLAIIGASILLFRRGALVAATASSLSYALLLAMLHNGWVVLTTEVSPRPVGRLVFEASIQIVAQFLIGVLAGFVAEQLSKTGGRLSAREQDLRQLVDLQNRIVSAMPSGLVTCDASGKVTFVNPAAAAILGVTEDVRGRTQLDELIPGVARVRTNARRAELQVATADGERTLGLTVTPLEANGALLVVFQDLTDLRRMQGELERIDRLATLGRMSAQLAHEVRNPLAAMRGSAQLLQTDALAGSGQEQLAQLIVRESDRLAALVDSYLRLARPPPPDRSAARIDQVVGETIEMLRADPMASGTSIEEALAPVEAPVDVAQLKQVLINLLRNAVTATRNAGTVRVTVGGTSDAALITVWDSAGSIPLEDQERIFEPFYTTSEGGTGLGLSTVKSILQAHGGSIEVSSSPQAGTTFTVRLARAAGEA